MRRSTVRLPAFAIAVGTLLLASASLALAQTAGKHPIEVPAPGDFARVQKLIDDAEDLIKAARQSDPLDAAKVHHAIEVLQRAARIDPHNDEAYVDLGYAYALLKDGDSAQDMYRHAVELNPSASNYKELADVYLRTGDAEQALMAANAGLLKDPRSAGLYNARGLALHDLDRFDEAARDFRKALQLDPSMTAARASLDALGPGYAGGASSLKKSHKPH